MTKAFISSEGRIAIPSEIRDRLNLKPGAEMSIEVQGESIIVKRTVPYDPDWRTMEGMAPGEGRLTDALMEERAAKNAHYERRIKGG